MTQLFLTYPKQIMTNQSEEITSLDTRSNALTNGPSSINARHAETVDRTIRAIPNGTMYRLMTFTCLLSASPIGTLRSQARGQIRPRMCSVRVRSMLVAERLQNLFSEIIIVRFEAIPGYYPGYDEIALGTGSRLDVRMPVI